MDLNPIVLCKKFNICEDFSPPSSMAVQNSQYPKSTVKMKKNIKKKNMMDARTDSERDVNPEKSINKLNSETSEAGGRLYRRISCGPSSSGQIEFMYYCFICNKYFTSKKGVTNHLRSHEGLKSLQCENCPKMFLNKKRLKTHMERVHSEPYKCEICDKKYAKASVFNYIRHKNTEHKFKCSECNMSYITKTHLMHHIKIHPVVHEFRCTLCPMTFSLKADLTRHAAMHAKSDQRLFRCSMCRELFSGIGALAAHYRSHVSSPVLKTELSATDQDKIEKKEIPVKKEQKLIKQQKSSTRNSKKSVENEGSKEVLFGRLSFGARKASLHVCYLCDTYFTKKTNLVKHLKSHTSLKRFSCKLCKRCYSTKDKFKDHRKLLHSRKCNKCNLRFAKSSHLKHHSGAHVEPNDK